MVSRGNKKHTPVHSVVEGGREREKHTSVITGAGGGGGGRGQKTHHFDQSEGWGKGARELSV